MSTTRPRRSRWSSASKYGDDDEDYKGTVTRDVYEVLDLLHKDMTKWAHPNPTTKTAFVYG